MFFKINPLSFTSSSLLSESERPRKRELVPYDSPQYYVVAGCNNGIGECHRNPVTFRGPKLPDF